MEKLLEHKINYYRLLLTLLMPAFYGVTGWVFINAKSIGSLRLIFLNLVITLLIIILCVINYKIRFYINQSRGNNKC